MTNNYPQAVQFPDFAGVLAQEKRDALFLDFHDIDLAADRAANEKATPADYLHVSLSEADYEDAALVGRMRYEEARKKGLQHKAGWGSVENDQIGSFGELAVAIVSGQKWNRDLVADKRGDVGKFQVRSTSLTYGSLFIYDTDSDTEQFILVRGEGHVFEIVGWMLGSEAKTFPWTDKGNGRGYHSVPARDLNKMSSLIPPRAFAETTPEQDRAAGARAYEIVMAERALRRLLNGAWRA